MNKILIAILIILGLLAVYFLGSTLIAYEEESKYVTKLYEDVKQNKDSETFIKYQNELYVYLDHTENEDYAFHTYALENKDLTQIILIISKKTIIEHATDIKDENDLTKFVIRTNNLLIDTKADERYKNYAMSYGFDDSKIGFIYIVQTITDDSFNIQYQDYHGNIQFEKSFEMPDDSAYQKGFTLEEKNKLIGLEKALKTKLIKYIGLYLVFVSMIVLVTIIYKQWMKSK